MELHCTNRSLYMTERTATDLAGLSRRIRITLKEAQRKRFYM